MKYKKYRTYTKTEKYTEIQKNTTKHTRRKHKNTKKYKNTQKSAKYRRIPPNPPKYKKQTTECKGTRNYTFSGRSEFALGALQALMLAHEQACCNSAKAESSLQLMLYNNARILNY